MSAQPDQVTALRIDLPPIESLPEDLRKYFRICQQKLGFVPNVLRAYSHNVEQLRHFSRFYNALMLGASGLSELDREMIAVTVSALNHCWYCLAAHGAAVRGYSGDPALGDLLSANFRAAELPERTRAMLEFATKVTERCDRIEEADRQRLRDAGFTDRDIWDIANVAAFYNMTNRVAAATGMQPNPEYHAQHRDRAGDS
jgi:uncharacterized peroxidase-related enzyme